MAIGTTTKDVIYDKLYDLFPTMREEEYQVLKADIDQNGLQVPIAYCNGTLIDGRHRLRALQELGRTDPADVKHIEVDPDQAAQYMVSANLHRRHLKESQLGIIIAKLCFAGQMSKSKAIGLKLVSEGIIASAKRIIKDCVPALVDKVSDGDFTIHAVESVRHYSPEIQHQLAAIPLSQWNSLLKQSDLTATPRKLKTSIVIDGHYAAVIDQMLSVSQYKNLGEYFRAIILEHLQLDQPKSVKALEA